jgi:hypothetical protein
MDQQIPPQWIPSGSARGTARPRGDARPHALDIDGGRGLADNVRARCRALMRVSALKAYPASTVTRAAAAQAGTLARADLSDR